MQIRRLLNRYRDVVVAEVGHQTYQITFDGSVAGEHGYVAIGGQADQVAAVLKERYAED